MPRYEVKITYKNNALKQGGDTLYVSAEDSHEAWMLLSNHYNNTIKCQSIKQLTTKGGE